MAEKTVKLYLSAAEKSRLAECEKVINTGLKTFVEVGKALIEIQRDKLYRASHPTFESYCRDKFLLSSKQAYDFIAAEKVIENLSPNGDNLPLPERESQTRPLQDLEPEKQREVYREAVKESGGRVPSARKIKEIKDKIIPVPEKPAGLVEEKAVEYIAPAREAEVKLAPALNKTVEVETDPGFKPGQRVSVILGKDKTALGVIVKKHGSLEGRYFVAVEGMEDGGDLSLAYKNITLLPDQEPESQGNLSRDEMLKLVNDFTDWFNLSNSELEQVIKIIERNK